MEAHNGTVECLAWDKQKRLAAAIISERNPSLGTPFLVLEASTDIQERLRLIPDAKEACNPQSGNQR
ncbi:MAG: hypothetical protein GIKADHBN_01136 [Phycisphaerales bacterium]|nr:hypothetical protein [Phycisphaerales bacterium]